MNKQYTVVSVTNKDGSASQSVGVEFVGKEVVAPFDLSKAVGGTAMLASAGSANGEYLRTSTVAEVSFKTGGVVVITTRNTLYTLKEVPFRTASQTGYMAFD